MKKTGKSAVAKRPNLVIVFPDQLRRDALGVYGDVNVSTPHIDALARNGVRFTQACSTYPVCVPFRFTLMTGEYAHSRFIPAIEWRMSPAERTLADEFNAAGYETLYVGKWHLYGGHGVLPDFSDRDSNRRRIPRRYQGRWKRWMGFDISNAPFDTGYFADDDPVWRPLGGYQTDALFDLAMKNISECPAGRPFCCVISPEPPHPRYEAPPEKEEKWAGKEMILPPTFGIPYPGDMRGQPPTPQTRETMLKNRRSYYGMIENLDDNVGKLVEFLEENGLADSTIIVFLSDHGEMGGCHGLPTWQKHFPFEESIGIPLIVSDPVNTRHAGKAIQEPVSSEDLFPTLLGLAGLKSASTLPGLDLAPLVRDPGQRLRREGVLLEYVYDLNAPGEFFSHYWRGFRSRRYKYTTLGPASGGRPWQFFDLAEDPYEQKNRIADPACAEEIRRHHVLLRERLIATDDLYALAPAWGIEGLNCPMP